MRAQCFSFQKKFLPQTTAKVVTATNVGAVLSPWANDPCLQLASLFEQSLHT
jgi:hypothetical protein